MVQGYERIGYQAVNVGGYDLLGGYAFLKALADSSTLPFLSANLIDKSTGKPAFEPYRILEQDGLRVGVIGVTAQLLNLPEELSLEDWIPKGQKYLQALQAETDLLVVLANVDQNQSSQLVESFSAADYIFISRTKTRSRAFHRQAPEGPYLYSSGDQGKYVSVVEATLVDRHQSIRDISQPREKLQNIQHRLENLQKRDPTQSLEKLYARQPNVLRLIKQYQQERIELEGVLEQVLNPSLFTSVPMNRNLESEPVLLAFVNQTLKHCDALKKPLKVSL